MAEGDFELFQRILARWSERRNRNEPLTALQIGSVALGRGGSPEARRVLQIIGRTGPFGRYFKQRGTYQWRVRWLEVDRDFQRLAPSDGPPPIDGMEMSTADPLAASVAGMLRAVDDERRAVREKQRKLRVYLGDGVLRQELDAADRPYLYEFKLAERDDDEPIPLPEGIPVDWVSPSSRVRVRGLLAGVDESAGTVWIASETLLPVKTAESYIEPDYDHLLVALRRDLELLSLVPAPAVVSALHGKDVAASPVRVMSPVLDDLDDTQAAAIQSALARPCGHVIWGPPGTGKTHTLGHLLASLIDEGKRVLAVATANVAVDRLAIATFRAIQRSRRPTLQGLVSDGRILRYGYPRDREVLELDELFAHRAARADLLASVREMRARRDRLPRGAAQQRATLETQLAGRVRELRQVVEAYLQNARLVFTTVAQALMDTTLRSTLFDVVVVDEASMVSLAHATAMAQRATVGLVLAGDWEAARAYRARAIGSSAAVPP